MRARSTGNPWVFLLLLLIGLVIGGVLGEVFSGVLPILGYSGSIGLTPPLTLNLGVLTLVFGFNLAINLASIIGLVIAILIFRMF